MGLFGVGLVSCGSDASSTSPDTTKTPQATDVMFDAMQPCIQNTPDAQPVVTTISFSVTNSGDAGLYRVTASAVGVSNSIVFGPYSIADDAHGSSSERVTTNHAPSDWTIVIESSRSTGAAYVMTGSAHVVLDCVSNCGPAIEGVSSLPVWRGCGS